jgi:hypothetical protein
VGIPRDFTLPEHSGFIRRLIMSKVAFSKIKASLSAPQLPEAVDGCLRFIEVLDHGMAFVVPEYEGAREGDTVTAHFAFARDTYPYEVKYQVERPQSFTLHVPRHVVLKLIGKVAVAQYWVERMDGSVFSSLSTKVQVMR